MFYFSESTIKIKRNLKHFLLFLRNAQAIHEMPRGNFQAMHVLPEKFRHYALGIAFRHFINA